MKLDDLVKSIATKQGLDPATTRAMLDMAFNQIIDAIARDEQVALTGFGRFSGKATKARTGRNPRTGQPMEIAASTKIVFAPAKVFKDRVGAPKGGS